MEHHNIGVLKNYKVFAITSNLITNKSKYLYYNHVVTGFDWETGEIATKTMHCRVVYLKCKNKRGQLIDM